MELPSRSPKDGSRRDSVKEMAVDVQKISNSKTIISLFVSFVGAGILGLPYAYSKVGISGGNTCMVVVGTIATYCMWMLVECTHMLKDKHIRGYGDIAYHAYGSRGASLVDFLLALTQTSFCVAYLIFIGTNLAEVFSLEKNTLILMCIPGLVGLVMIRHIKQLSPFIFIANVANLVGVVFVFYAAHQARVETSLEALESRSTNHTTSHLDAVANVNFGVKWKDVPFFMGVAIYCFEGVGTVVPIERSMEHPQEFMKLLVMMMVIITVIYCSFGSYSYMAFGSLTEELITLNFSNGIASQAVKVSVCCGLYFTYALMMFPVHLILEQTQCIAGSESEEARKKVLRVSLVLLVAFTAISVPDFEKFLSFVGAFSCNLLAIMLPCAFFYKLKGHTDEFKVHIIPMLWIVLFGICMTIYSIVALFVDQKLRR